MNTDERLATLEAQMAALLQQAPVPPPTRERAGAATSKWWLLDRLPDGVPAAAGEATGDVVYGGRVTTAAGELVWQAQHAVPDVLSLDALEVAPLVAALGHPVRIELLRRILLGAHTLAELQGTTGIRTAGQAHHHLRELRNAGFIVSGRNHFAVVAERVIPALTALAAIAGPARLTPVLPDPGPAL